jgi:hypothetical protein
VAEAEKASKKGNLTRGKAILIAMLAVVLVAILYVQFGSAGAQPASTSAIYRPPSRKQAMQETGSLAKVMNPTTSGGGMSKKEEATPVIEAAHWKSPALSAVVAHDPFALPITFPHAPQVTVDGKTTGEGLLEAAAADDAKKLAAAVEKIRMQMEELEKRGVTVILRERDQYAAVIGDRLLHVGDEISEGLMVTAIDPDGVRIERKGGP